jgi:hypothetical protein
MGLLEDVTYPLDRTPYACSDRLDRRLTQLLPDYRDVYVGLDSTPLYSVDGARCRKILEAQAELCERAARVIRQVLAEVK